MQILVLLFLAFIFLVNTPKKLYDISDKINEEAAKGREKARNENNE